MTKMMTTTALIAMLAVPAFAQTATTETAPATTPPAATDTMTTTAPMAAPATDAAMAPAGTEGGFGYMATPTDMSAETFIGKNLYVAETDVDSTATYNEVDASWNDVGEINDLVLDASGQVKAVLIDVGGFLGMGEKSVAVSMDQLRMIRDGDSENEYFIVFTASRESLESAPAFEWPARS